MPGSGPGCVHLRRQLATRIRKGRVTVVVLSRVSRACAEMFILTTGSRRDARIGDPGLRRLSATLGSSLDDRGPEPRPAESPPGDGERFAPPARAAGEAHRCGLVIRCEE